MRLFPVNEDLAHVNAKKITSRYTNFSQKDHQRKIKVQLNDEDISASR